MKKALLVALVVGLVLARDVWPGSAGDVKAPHLLIEMQPVSFMQWGQVLERQKGNITVVDLWASWCSPCLERFPHMVALHHKYQAQGVRFISLNFDEQGDLESLHWANQFLSRVEAVFPNYHMNENMSDAFEKLDLLGLPVVLIYDAKGNQAFRLSGDNPNQQFTDRDVENSVLDLLVLPVAATAD